MFSMTKYHLILNIRERTMAFWTLAFPILLGLFFYFGIGGVDEASKFEPVPVAMTGFEESKDGLINKESMFREFIDGISGEMVIPEYNLTKEVAERKLEEGKITGIFDVKDGNLELTVEKEGMSESILAAMLDGFEQKSAILKDVKENAGPQEYMEVMETLKEDSKDYVADVSLGGNDVSSVTSYYFALFAMACLYMCFLGETAAKRTQANISEIGKRITVSPVHRMKMVLSNGISAYMLSLINISLVMIFFTKIVGGIDISMHPVYAVATAMAGCLIGVTFGIMIESIGKWSQNIKSAILIGSSIFCAFLAGLMISSMKDIIEKYVPFINRINPAALIADSFYCICVYDDMHRLTVNLGIMGVMSAVFLLVAWLLTRRVNYDSL